MFLVSSLILRKFGFYSILLVSKYQERVYFSWWVYILADRIILPFLHAHHLAPGSCEINVMLLSSNDTDLSTSPGCANMHAVNIFWVSTVPGAVLGVVYTHMAVDMADRALVLLGKGTRRILAWAVEWMVMYLLKGSVWKKQIGVKLNEFYFVIVKFEQLFSHLRKDIKKISLERSQE